MNSNNVQGIKGFDEVAKTRYFRGFIAYCLICLVQGITIPEGLGLIQPYWNVKSNYQVFMCWIE